MEVQIKHMQISYIVVNQLSVIAIMISKCHLRSYVNFLPPVTVKAPGSKFLFQSNYCHYCQYCWYKKIKKTKPDQLKHTTNTNEKWFIPS